MPTLDEILEPLKDGKWHNLREINEALGLPEEKLEEVMRFFAKYRFIELDRKHKRARLMSSVLEFFPESE